MDSLRLPPHSTDAEQAVLGGIFKDVNAFDKVADILTATDFYRNDHGTIYSEIALLQGSNQPCDIVTVAESLESKNMLEEVGGLGYLAQVAENTPSAANVAAYATIVKKHAVGRETITVASEVQEAVFDPQGKDIADILDTAQQRMLSLSTSKSGSGLLHVRDAVGETIDRIDKHFQAGGGLLGIPTGFNDVDERLSGLVGGDLIVIAGRPSMGKTSFAMNIAEHNSLNDINATAVFSMEMPRAQLIERMASGLGKIPYGRIRNGKLEGDDWKKLTDATAKIAASKLFIDDTSALSVSEIRARSRRLARTTPLSLVVVDYIQLMDLGGTDNTTEGLNNITKGLKQLARDLSVPVIALSQLNRGVESRNDKRPVMSDLRGSGGIEQDADVVICLYRDEVYDEASPDKGIAEIITRKQRNGAIGTDRLAFQGQFVRFENYIQEDSYTNYTASLSGVKV